MKTALDITQSVLEKAQRFSDSGNTELAIIYFELHQELINEFIESIENK